LRMVWSRRPDLNW